MAAVVHSRATVKAESEGEGLLKIIRRGWGHAFIVGYARTVSAGARTRLASSVCHCPRRVPHTGHLSGCHGHQCGFDRLLHR
jgi:hypothetical protein